MPRIGALLSLSREHHTSLVVARDARRVANTGDPAVLSTAIREIESHCATLLVRHFEVEERLLETVGTTFDAEVAARIRAEHEELRKLACNTCELTPIDRLRRFGELLGSHVRYEERTAFPQLQSHSCIINTDI